MFFFYSSFLCGIFCEVFVNIFFSLHLVRVPTMETDSDGRAKKESRKGWMEMEMEWRGREGGVRPLD